MRIGMVADMYTPHVSGVTNQITLLCEALDAAGHEAHIITFGKQQPTDTDRVHRSPGFSWGDTGWQFPMGLSKDALETLESMDVLHVHHPFVSAEVARDVARRTGAVVALTNHTRYDLYADTYAPWIPGRHLLTAHRMRTVFESADVVIAPSQEIKEWMAEYSGFDGSVVVHNGIKVSDFGHGDREAARRRLGIASDAVVFVTVGRASKEKGFDDLVEMFLDLTAENPDLVLVAAGGGPLLEECSDAVRTAGCEDRIQLLGNVLYSELPDILAAADAFVSASASEGYPLVFMEAAASGLPLFGIASPGTADIVRPGTNGFLARDAAELKSLVAHAADDREGLAELGESTRIDAARFDVNDKAAQLVALYEKALASRQ